MIRLAVVCALAAVAFANPLFANQPFDLQEKNFFASLAAGDDIRQWSAVCGMALCAPEDVRASLYLAEVRRFADIIGYDAAANVFTNLLSSPDVSPELRFNVLLEYEKLNTLYKKNPSPPASVISRWHVTGPFVKYGNRADFHQDFLSEQNIKRDAVLVNADETSGFVELAEALYPNDGIFYAEAEISYDKETLLHIFCAAPYILFVNGKAAIDNTGRDKRNHRILRAHAGTNKLLLKSAGRRFRVLAANEQGEPAGVGASLKELPPSPEPIEQEVWPANLLAALPEDTQAAKLDKLFRQGLYYQELGSPLALDCFKSAAESGNAVYAYYYAEALRRVGYERRHDAKAMQIMLGLNSDDANFAPANYFKLVSLINENNVDAVLRQTYRAAERKRDFSYSLMLMDFLNAQGCDKEFADVHKLFAETFPNSPFVLKSRAMFLQRRNKAAFAECAVSLLETYKDDKLLAALADYYIAAGEYDAAITLLDEYGGVGQNKLLKARALAGKGNFNEAEELLASVKTPEAQYGASIASMLTGKDGSPHLEKALALNPALFGAEELLAFIKTGGFPALQTFRQDLRLTPFADIEPYEQPCRILSRTRRFVLAEGGSRVLCTDVIHLNTNKSVERLGEFQIPYSGKLHSALFRVYYEDGGFRDTYSMRAVGGSYYVHINGLKTNSILVMQYIIDNPVKRPYPAAFEHREDFIAGWEEPVDSFDVTITLDSNIPLTVQTNTNAQVQTYEDGKTKTYRISGGPLPAVYNERNSYGALSLLPWFKFSSVNEDELAEWYSGLINIPSEPELAEIAAKLKGANDDSSMQNIFRFVADKLALQQNILFAPDTPLAAIANGMGTPEDKVVTAIALLAETGVVAYPAFVRSANLPQEETVRGASFFDHILLFVPKSNDAKDYFGEGLWWDFSAKGIAAGTVSPQLAGANAFVLVNGKWKKLRVTSAPSIKKEDFAFTLNGDGGGECKMNLEFPGYLGEFRSVFATQATQEDRVTAYCGGLFPTFAIKTYRFENLDVPNAPFKLYAAGSLLSLAVCAEKRLIIEPVKCKSEVYDYVNYPSRRHTLVVLPINEAQTYEYILPANFAGGEINKRVVVKSPFGSAEFVFAKQKGDAKLTAAKNITLNRCDISPRDYGEFLNFCTKIKETESLNFILYADE